MSAPPSVQWLGVAMLRFVVRAGRQVGGRGRCGPRITRDAGHGGHGGQTGHVREVVTPTNPNPNQTFSAGWCISLTPTNPNPPLERGWVVGEHGWG
jgi:hypothetical protein